MKIISDPQEMQQTALSVRAEGRTIALVPTMGFLHAGHASLLQEGRKRGDLLVLSIFVNPTQFGPTEDLDRYPRDMERDCRIAEEAGVDIVFAPRAADIYPDGFQTYVEVGALTEPLCGASRPGHFKGVTTVVAKLFALCQPHVALFGKKDFQQLAVIRRMTADLNMPVAIIPMPIVREPDGLAMSSRNSYLSPEQRAAALCLSRAISEARKRYQLGETGCGVLLQVVRATVTSEPSVIVEYLELRDSVTLKTVETADDRTLLALAVKIGATRLIDNCILGEQD